MTIKRLSLFLAIILLFSNANAQRRVFSIDSLNVIYDLEVSGQIRIGNNDITTFLETNVSGNRLDGGTGIEDSTITTAKLTSATLSYIDAAGGGTISNNADDETTYENGSSQIAVKERALLYALVDTLTASDTTPSVDGYVHFITANAIATTITNFDDPPGTGYTKICQVQIGDDYTKIADNTNIDCNGIALAPLTGDILELRYTGSKWFCKFIFINW